MGSFVPFKDSLGSYVAQLEARIRNLENTPAAGYQSIAEGALVILNAAGEAVVIVGLQEDGRFGLSVANSDGVLQQVGGTLAANGTNLVGYSSFTPVSLSASITTEIGPSGLALVTASSLITCNTSSDSGTVETYVNGAFSASGPTLFGQSGITIPAVANVAQTTQCTSTRLCNCGSGGKTFDLYAKASTGGTGSTFAEISLVVQPL